jgi:hypothetical protein
MNCDMCVIKPKFALLHLIRCKYNAMAMLA